MKPSVHQELREALRMLSFRRYGMAAEALEEVLQSTSSTECRYWLAYAYRRMRRYDQAIGLLRRLKGCRQELEKIKAERRSYQLFRQAMELQGRGEYHEVRRLLREAREAVTDDPELAEWIAEELEFYDSPLFD